MGNPKVRVAINGFGRIGRTAFKIAFDNPDIEIVALNDLTDTKTLAHLLKYDSNYGTYRKEVGFDSEHIIVDGLHVPVYSQKDPSVLPWKELDADCVIESTGRFTTAEESQGHIKAGAKLVVISAPAKGAGVHTVVLGVNNDDLKKVKKGVILSNASCTTNCITPVAEVIHSNFKILKSFMTTIHSYTADQNLQDGPHNDLRRARGAALNIVPTSTGATKATGEVIPELGGVFDGLSIRVPTAVGSLSDFTFLVKKKTSVEEVNDVIKKAANNPRYKGILTYTNDEIVSSDIVGNPHSGIVDLSLTSVVDGDLVKVIAWYDNEFGYSNRLIELVVLAGKQLKG